MGFFKALFARGTESDGSGVLDVVAARSLQERGATLIDVREPSEFAAGHARGARNIPLAQVAARATEVPADEPVLLICRSGGRSGQAQATLHRLGHTNTHNVTGGTTAWRAAGLPME